jgi:hypothetical protein
MVGVDGSEEADVDGEQSSATGTCHLEGVLLLLRAKLEAVEGGYSTVEREFLADVLLPGGGSVGQMVSAVVETAYLTGVPPGLLPQAVS